MVLTLKWFNYFFLTILFILGMLHVFQEIKQRHDTLHPAMVKVEGGTFTMGCTVEQDRACDDDEKPRHQVSLNAYYMGKYEVSNEQFCAFLNEEGKQKGNLFKWIKLDSDYCQIEFKHKSYIPKADKANYPVVQVSWFGAKAYCTWLVQKTGEKYRLPTEAEWEFAARGGNQNQGYVYAGTTAEPTGYAWYDENSTADACAVGGKKVNELGLYDMSGNVWEWCADWYDAYTNEVETNPQGPEVGRGRVVRGGCCYSKLKSIRVTNRDANPPFYRASNLGFRLAKTP